MGSTPTFRVGIGECSHRFLSADSTKTCIIAGIVFDECPGLLAQSDGDVVVHALCSAIASLSGEDVFEGIAKDLLHKDGITDSQVYLEKAQTLLGSQKIAHVAISIEAKRPNIAPKIVMMRKKLAEMLKINIASVGISHHFADGLTDVSCGEGIKCTALLTTQEY